MRSSPTEAKEVIFDSIAKSRKNENKKKTKKCILNIFKILTKTMTVRRVCLFY